MPFNKGAYDIQYARDNITRKFLCFNNNDEEDKKVLDWLNGKGKGNVNGYVKRLIREDMEKALKNADS